MAWQHEIGVEQLASFQAAGAPTYWAHWVLKSARHDRMVAWYRTVFGARVVFGDARLTFLTWDGEHHRIAIVRMPALLWPLAKVAWIWRKLYGLDHISFNFGSFERLLSTYERLKHMRIVPVWCINHGPTTSLYYEDPDGNRIELQVENFDTPAALSAFAQSGEFQRNPIGVNFDPDYLFERLRAGTPVETLRLRGSGTRPGTEQAAGMKTITWKTL